MKRMLRETFPALYRQLARLKDAVFPPERWGHVFRGEGTYAVPEPSLAEIEIPAFVDTFFDVGCAAGRNLVPFDGTLKLRAADVVPYEHIRWVRDFKNLTYEQQTVEQLTYSLKGQDLSTTLIFTCAVLSYVKPDDQWAFFRTCLEAGCRAFLFYEFPQGSRENPNDHNFKLPAQLFRATTEGKFVSYTLFL